MSYAISSNGSMQFQLLPVIVGGGAVPAGARIVVQAFQKEFIVYGAVTDNHTNDPSIRIGSD